MTNKSSTQDALNALTREVREEGNLNKQGRYWASICAMGFLGIRYANKLKLWDFDYDKTYQRVMDILAGAKAETIPLNENDTQILGEYLISRGPNTLTINSKIDKRVENTFNDDDKREAVGEPDMIPRSSIIYVRQEPDTRFIFINRSVIYAFY